MGKASFLSESKCRTNGKIMVFNLHKFEPPQINATKFYIFISPSTYTPSSPFRFQVFSSLSIMPIPLLLRQKEPFPDFVRDYYLAYTPSTTQKTTERMECNMSSTESYAIHEDHLVLPWIWLLTFLLYCDNDSRLLFSVRNGGSKFLIKDTRYKATFYFLCDKKKSHILQIKCRTLKYWHILLSCTMLRFSYDSL